MSITLPSGAGAVGGAPVDLLIATIANGQTTSNAIDMGGRMLAGIDTGGTLTGVTLTYTHSVDDSTYRAVYDSTGNAISWSVAGNRLIKFNPPIAGLCKIKLVSGSAEGNDRTLTLVCAP